MPKPIPAMTILSEGATAPSRPRVEALTITGKPAAPTAAAPQEIAARLSKILDRFSATSHHLSNVSIQLDGDQATSMAYVYAFHRMADTNDPMHYWGRWVDRLVRLDEGWRFAEREVVGIGSIEPDGAGRTRKQPGHPGRLTR